MSDATPTHLTDDNFSSEVLEFPGLVLVDFWAEWCHPCRVVAPIIAKIAEKYQGNEKIKIAKLDIEEANQTAGQYRIMSIPTLLLFNKGEQVEMLVGVQPTQVIEKMLEKGLAELD